MTVSIQVIGPKFNGTQQGLPDQQQQNLRCAKILEGRNAPFLKMFLSVSNSFVPHFYG